MEKSNVALNMIENANSPVIFFTFYNLRKPCIESSCISSQTLQIRMIDREFPLCFQLFMVCEPKNGKAAFSFGTFV
jgi:hypothetical protein